MSQKCHGKTFAEMPYHSFAKLDVRSKVPAAAQSLTVANVDRPVRIRSDDHPGS
jgi:hypothetical protein